MFGILVEFWMRQEVATWENEYHVPQFHATRGTTKGGLVSPNLFNLVINNVVHNWLSMPVEDELVAQDGMGLAVGRCIWIFYADDSLVGLRDPE